MNLQSYAAMLRFDLTNTMKDRVAVGMLLIFPVALYIFFATFFGAARTEASQGEYYETYTVNFAAVILLNIALLNLAPTIVMAKEGGLFRRLLATPLTPGTMLAAAITRALIIFVLGYLGILALGYLALGHLPHASLANLAVPALLSAFCILSIGFLLGAWFDRATTAFNAGMILVQPMLLLSGAGFPRESFPHWAYALSSMLPFTYAVQAMQLGWNGEFFTAPAVLPTLVLFGTGGVCIAASSHLFRRELN